MASQTKLHWPSLLQFIFSGFFALSCLGLAALLVVLGLIDKSGAISVSMDALPIFMSAASLSLAGVLLLPSTVYSFLRLIGKPSQGLRLTVPRWVSLILPLALIPAVLWIGNWAATESVYDWLLLPPLTLLAVSLPIFWFFSLGAAGLSCRSPQRAWGVFATGLVVGPGLIMTIEIMMGTFLILAGTIVVASNPEWMAEMSRLSQRLVNAQFNQAVVRRILAPYLVHPAVLYAMIAVGTALVALIEELLKPLGLWIQAKHPISTEDGFFYGLICGATFALFESLGVGSNLSGSDWWPLMVGRMGTGLLHTLTAALMGWALVSAWRERKFLLLGGAYLITVLIHSLWNLMSLLIGYGPFAGMLPRKLIFIQQLSQVAPVGLGVLVAINLAILVLANRTIRHTPETPGTIP